MRVCLYHDDYGPAEALHVADVAMPEPGPGMVRVAVRAAGINPADYNMGPFFKDPIQLVIDTEFDHKP